MRQARANDWNRTWMAAAAAGMFTLFGCRSHPPADPASIPEQPLSAERSEGATKPVAGSSWKEAGESSAPGPAATSFPPAPTSQRTHTVRKGDTIYSLARLYYGGDVHRWHSIFDANRDKLSNPDQLKIGQILVIPG